MKKTLKILLIISLVYFTLTLFTISYAASANISANKTSVTVGDSVTVTVTIKAASWNITVSGSASDTIVGYNADGENQTTTKTYTIDTSKAGTYKVSISGDVTDASDANTKINDSVTITVKEKEVAPDPDPTPDPTPTTKSNNAYLKTLGVTPKEYDFSGFKKDKTEYSVTVPNNVDKLNVIAVAEEKDKAKVEISGNTGFKVGSDNKIIVKVTAEDGTTTKEYTIRVTKLAEDEELPGNIIEDADELFLTKLEIEGIDEMTPAFAKDVYFYKAILRSDLDELVINAIANNPNAKITITGNKDLKEGENIITIIVTYEGKVEQKVYQVTLVKDLSPEEADILTIGANDEKNGPERYVIVGILLILFIISVIAILVFLIKKEKRKLMSYGEYDEEDVEEVPPLKSRKHKRYHDDDEDEIEEVPPLKPRKLYDQDKDEDYRRTIEEINAQTRSIFNKDEDKDIDGQSVEFEDDFPKSRKRGKH